MLHITYVMVFFKSVAVEKMVTINDFKFTHAIENDYIFIRPCCYLTVFPCWSLNIFFQLYIFICSNSERESVYYVIIIENQSPLSYMVESCINMSLLMLLK